MNQTLLLGQIKHSTDITGDLQKLFQRNEWSEERIAAVNLGENWRKRVKETQTILPAILFIKGSREIRVYVARMGWGESREGFF